MGGKHPCETIFFSLFVSGVDNRVWVNSSMCNLYKNT